jgi:hypothetical protein
MSGEEQQTNPEAELSLSQAAIKELADEMLALRPEGYDMNVIHFAVDQPAQDVEEKLKEYSFSDLLLKDGDSLSADPPNSYHHDLGLYIGQAQPYAVEVRAWGWDYDADSNPIKVGDQKPVVQWGRNLEIKIWYSNDDQAAGQEIGIGSWSYHAGDIPRFHRDVTAPAYAEMGYEGHNQKIRDAKDEEEVLKFVDLVRELFASSHQRGAKNI